MRMNQHIAKSFLRHGRKRTTVITVGILIVIMICVYATASVWAWSQYRNAYVGRQTDARSKLDAVLAMPVDTSSNRAKWLTGLESVVVSDADSCTMSGLYRWQTGIVGSLKQDVASCTKVQQGIEDVDKQIEIVVKSIRSEQQIATILAAPLKVASVDEANYQTQKDTWHGIIEALGKVDVPSGITPVKIAAVGDASAIESAWSALVTAHTAQNAPDYESACAALTTAYKDMNGVGDESKKAFQYLGDALKQSYNLAFTN